MSDHGTDAAQQGTVRDPFIVDGIAEYSENDIDGIFSRVVIGICLQNIELPDVTVDGFVGMGTVLLPIEAADLLPAVYVGEALEVQSAVVQPFVGIHGIDPEGIQLFYGPGPGLLGEPVLSLQHGSVGSDHLPADRSDLFLLLCRVVALQVSPVHGGVESPSHDIKGGFFIGLPAFGTLLYVTRLYSHVIGTAVQ